MSRSLSFSLLKIKRGRRGRGYQLLLDSLVYIHYILHAVPARLVSFLLLSLLPFLSPSTRCITYDVLISSTVILSVSGLHLLQNILSLLLPLLPVALSLYRGVEGLNSNRHILIMKVKTAGSGGSRSTALTVVRALVRERKIRSSSFSDRRRLSRLVSLQLATSYVSLFEGC